jgi:hypothetical protein
MTFAEVNGLLSQFGQEAGTYHYFRDKYALLLTAWNVGEGKRVTDAKRSRFGGLLQKELLKQHCASHTLLRESELLLQAAQEGWTFRRSLDTWGDEDEWGCQVSRPGINLVLRLDFGQEQDRQASRLRIGNVMEGLEYQNHMNFQESHNLAWCRLDLDWETGEVLIEEIQNDWLRSAQRLLVTDHHAYDPWYWRPKKMDQRNSFRFWKYHQEVLQPLEKVWAEATLCATLEFIRNDLGLRTVYMHTPECGVRVKGMSPYNAPPRSLYHDLPKRFCFEATSEVPAFLSRSWSGVLYQDEEFLEMKKRLARPFSFWKMEL